MIDSVETDYDLLDRKVQERKKDLNNVIEALTQYSYDSFGRLDCTAVRMNQAAYGSLPASACTLGTQGTNGPDRITRNTYDAGGQLLTVTEAVGTPDQAVEATYAYTGSGKKATLTDARGFKAQMVYDGHDRQTQWRFPDKVTPGVVSTTDFEQYSYDNNGNRLTLKKRDGSTLSFAYDNLNRMTVKTVPERANLEGIIPSATRDVYMAYDLQGHQLSARFDSGSGEGLTSDYDALGRVSSTALAMDSVTRTFGHQYDIRGIRTSVTHPDATMVTYTPDTLGRLTGLAQGATALRGYSYDGNGRLTGSALGTGTPGSTTFGYDTIGRLNVLGHSLAATPAANVTWNNITYNPASQLLTQTRDNDSYAWTGAVTTTRNYATNGLNQYTAAGEAAFTYDANGNLTADGTNTYLYDVENRLVSASIGGSSPQTVTLRYDPMGRLYEVTGSVTGTTRFLYDGDELIGEYTTAGALLRRYVHGLGIDDPVVWYEGSGTGSTGLRHLIADRQGSVVGIADSNGAIIAKNTYDEYGIPKSDQAGQKVVGRFAYTGQIWLPELGLYHYKARLYSPTLGRFLQTDPIGYDDQINLYAYVGNDPVNASDPTGTRLVLSGTVPERAALRALLLHVARTSPRQTHRLLSLINSKNSHFVRPAGRHEGSNAAAVIPWNASNGVGTGSVAAIDLNGTRTIDGFHSPASIVAHEVLTHQYQIDKGILDTSKNPETGVKRSEEAAVQVENDYRKTANEPKRETYGGKKVSDHPYIIEEGRITGTRGCASRIEESCK